MPNCKNCGTPLWQEHTRITDTHQFALKGKEAQMVCDNWHCQKCGSVYLNSEIDKEEELEAIKELGWDDARQAQGEVEYD